jgi:hypothetical protein
MRTEAWWCCSCGAKINRVGRSDPDRVAWHAHVKTCPLTERKKQAPPGVYICQGMHIKQMPQGKP